MKQEINAATGAGGGQQRPPDQAKAPAKPKEKKK
jgi:hypothetical protein